MLSMDRHQYILRYLEENGNSTRKELAKLLNVTIMTIGRDFKRSRAGVATTDYPIDFFQTYQHSFLSYAR